MTVYQCPGGFLTAIIPTIEAHAILPLNNRSVSNAINGLAVPVLCWNGTEDPYHRTMSGWAPAHGHQYFSVPGDHLSCFYLHGRDAATRMADFFTTAA